MLTITQTENSASQTSHPQFLRAYFRQKEVLATHLHFWACWTCFDPLTRRSCLVRYQTFTRFVRETNERKKRVFQISKKEETDLILIWVSRPKSIQLRPPLSFPPLVTRDMRDLTIAQSLSREKIVLSVQKHGPLYILSPAGKSVMGHSDVG